MPAGARASPHSTGARARVPERNDPVLQGRARADLRLVSRLGAHARGCRRVVRRRYPAERGRKLESPSEMIQFFKDVRAQIFGSFRVSELSPEGAVVLFDADTLRNEAGSWMHGA